MIIPGLHNIYNALAIVSVLDELGFKFDDYAKYFSEFSGMGRRFQKVCDFSGIQVFDDYAHHPTEIKAVLDAAATKFGKENIVAVFQPHRYTRLKGLWTEFKDAFYNADRVIVTDVYEASETPIEGITGENFAKEAGFEYTAGSIQDVADELYLSLKSGNIVVGLGAGTITNLGKYLKEVNLASRV